MQPNCTFPKLWHAMWRYISDDVSLLIGFWDGYEHSSTELYRAMNEDWKLFFRNDYNVPKINIWNHGSDVSAERWLQSQNHYSKKTYSYLREVGIGNSLATLWFLIFHINCPCINGGESSASNYIYFQSFLDRIRKHNTDLDDVIIINS